MEIRKFADIPKFAKPEYEVSTGWGCIEKTIAEWEIDLEPEYQRVHVWTPEQQTKYVEFCLRGGDSGKNLYFNYKLENYHINRNIEIVDGKQRLTAARRFMNGEIPAFGRTLSQFEDHLHPLDVRFKFFIYDFKTKAEIIQWYLDLNFAGTPHTEEERQRVQKLLEEQK